MATKEKELKLDALQDKIYEAIKAVGDIEDYMADKLPKEYEQMKPTILNIIDQLYKMDETQESWWDD